MPQWASDQGCAFARETRVVVTGSHKGRVDETEELSAMAAAGGRHRQVQLFQVAIAAGDVIDVLHDPSTQPSTFHGTPTDGAQRHGTLSG